MFEDIFKKELSVIGIDPTTADQYWREIVAAYTSKGRYYHNLVHLDKIAEQLLLVKERIADWTTIVFAVAYHDFVYNPLKNDNEEQSAGFAYKRLQEWNLPTGQCERCRRQILLTKGHQLSDDDDDNYFTDADLSVLGADSATYQLYTRQVRKEYRYFPDLLYRPGRKKAMQHFLGMERIFKTDFFWEKYEQQARRNISGEVGMPGFGQ